jgi:hypothetical protein
MKIVPLSKFFVLGASDDARRTAKGEPHTMSVYGVLRSYNGVLSAWCSNVARLERSHSPHSRRTAFIFEQSAQTISFRLHTLSLAFPTPSVVLQILHFPGGGISFNSIATLPFDLQAHVNRPENRCSRRASFEMA